MRPRFVGRLGLADMVTASNAALGFVAAVLTAIDVRLAAKAILLAAVADGLDGVVARHYGGTEAGPYLDSLADVASFGVAPALLVVAVVREMWGFDQFRVVLGIAIAALFVAAAVVRLALYTAYDSGSDETIGVPTTLAATILSAGVLVGFVDPMLLVVLSAIMAALMLSDVTYPDLHAQDALVMGVVQGLAILLSGTIGEGFAFGLLFLALGYLFLGPKFYWG
ncbi:protein sorting system archaetidylserine synthase [Haloferax sp. DFSO52]|uniref:protein sorting system archaetidylserine synthase n=1 Tax=Haloferax sp. DFSO52 TaxID=3388505 RepID=UPI003A840BAE